MDMLRLAAPMAAQYDPVVSDEMSRACPACGARGLARWREASASDPALARHPSYPLLCCPTCGSACLAGLEPESGDLYEAGTYAPTGRLRSLVGALLRLVAWDRRRALGRLPGRCRVLEVGAGRGRLSADLASRGHAVAAIEPAAAAAAATRARGVEVQNLALERARFDDESFDRVVLWHVLEHLDDPAGALARVRPWLAPGGRVVVAVPNLDSVQARIGGDRWFHQDVPRHRTQFTAEGARRLLERSGFSPGQTRHVLVEHNPLGMWVTLLNRLTGARDVPFRFLKRDLSYSRRRDAVRDAAITLTVGVPLVLIAIVLEAVAGLLRRGGTVVVEASVAQRHGGRGSI